MGTRLCWRLLILREWRFCAEGKAGSRGEGGRREVLRDQLRPCRGGDHCGVICGQRKRGKGDRQAPFCGRCGEARAEFAVRSHTAGDEQAVCAVVLGRGEGLALEVIDDGALEGGEEVEGLLV
jgi:hypothetical protein